LKSVPQSNSTFPQKIVIASRKSTLALWQSNFIRQRLLALYPDCEISIFGITTSGDKMLSGSLAAYGGKGLFVKELEEALAAGDADIAVHSMKDVPMTLPEGFTLAAITEREDPRDVFVSNTYKNLSELPPNSIVGTSSLRRAYQLKAQYPKIITAQLRGNIDTRLRKLDAGEYSGIILAAAGLNRLGLANRITSFFDPQKNPPAIGQGALGIECLETRPELINFLKPLNHDETSACVRAERALGTALSASCQLPLGGFAVKENNSLKIFGFVASEDGKQILQAQAIASINDPEAAGKMLADKLIESGAKQILAQAAH
jgi:hydroxymethylbilane synthase